jgi:general secretion pathway protein L
MIALVQEITSKSEFGRRLLLETGTAWNRLAAFLGWWLSELLSMVPAPMAEKLFPGRDAVMIRDRGKKCDICILRSTRRSKEQEPSRFTIDRSEPDDGDLEKLKLELGVLDNPLVTLVLSGDRALSSEITLPRLSPRERRQALDLRWESEFPLTRESACYASELLESGEENDNLLLSVVRRKEIDGLVASLEFLDIPVEVIAMEARSPNHEDAVPLEGSVRGTFRLSNPKEWMRRILPALLLVVALAIYVIRLDSGRAEIKAALGEVSGELQTLGKLEDDYRKARLIEDFLAGHARSTSAVAAIDALSSVLPGTAWISEFRLSGDAVRIAGFAKNPARLVGLLEATPVFREVRLGTVVTSSSDPDRERYLITLRLEDDAS